MTRETKTKPCSPYCLNRPQCRRHTKQSLGDALGGWDGAGKGNWGGRFDNSCTQKELRRSKEHTPGIYISTDHRWAQAYEKKLKRATQNSAFIKDQEECTSLAETEKNLKIHRTLDRILK